MSNEFSKDELLRYSRQINLPIVGEAGQRKLKNAKVLLIGAGGLGSSPAIYLTAAGVGTVGLIDADIVSLSNLHRQILYYTSDIDKPKVVSAKEKLNQINPEVKVKTHQERLNIDNAISIISQYDLIIDGTDNIPSRYLINDACFFAKKPFIYGGVHQFEGQLSLFAHNGPCYRCFFSEPPPLDEMPSCVEAGVIGVIPGIIGLFQANEAIKWICGIGETLLGRLIIFDALSTHMRDIKIKKDPDCALCGKKPTILKLDEMNWVCPTQKKITKEISVVELSALRTKQLDIFLLDVREENEWNIAHIDGAKLLPMSKLEKDFSTLPKDKTIYCYCKMGGRSTKAIEFLKSQGYNDLILLKGGIEAWSKEIDLTLPQY